MSQVVTNTTDLSTLTVGKSTEVDLKMRTPRWVKLYNASPFFLTVNTKNTEFHSLGPGEEDMYALDEATPVISIQATAQLNLQNPPATALISTAYDQTNRPDGNFPTFNNIFVGVGNALVAANQVIQDGVAAPNVVVEATPQGAGSSQLLFRNDGSGLFSGGNITYGTDGKLHLIEAILGVNAGVGNQEIISIFNSGVGTQHPWKWFYNNDGSITLQDVSGIPFTAIQFAQDKSGNLSAGQITWDTAGHISTPRVTITDRLLWKGTLGGAAQFFAELLPTDLPGAGKEWDMVMNADGSIQITEATDNFRALKLGINKSGDLSGGQITWDASGNLSVPNLLEIAGQQETGHYFTQFVPPSVVAWVFWVPFRKQMTNLPASITLSGATATNCTATVSGITKTGFRLNLTPTVANTTTSWDGDWTTVGN